MHFNECINNHIGGVTFIYCKFKWVFDRTKEVFDFATFHCVESVICRYAVASDHSFILWIIIASTDIYNAHDEKL